MVHLLRADELESHRGSVAKKTATFRRIPRFSCKDAILFPEPGQLLAFSGGEPGLTVSAMRARLAHAVAQRRFRHAQIERCCGHRFPSSKTSRNAPAL